MKSTTMVPFTEKQEQIARVRQQVVEGYPQLWRRILAEWRQDGSEDRAWLIYSANYLLRSGNIRWAVDPISLRWRIPEAPEMDAAADLQGLSFVILTHSHKDHLDYDLLGRLSDQPIWWVVPDFMVDQVSKKARLPLERILPARSGELIRVLEFSITPFEGLHVVKEARGEIHGVPELGYLVEQNGKRWLFPGDTRIYAPERLPDFGRLDSVFAHVWLGRGAALEPTADMLDAFCRFFGRVNTTRLYLTHLQEISREAGDYWDGGHVERILAVFRREFPEKKVEQAVIGDSIVI